MLKLKEVKMDHDDENQYKHLNIEKEIDNVECSIKRKGTVYHIAFNKLLPPRKDIIEYQRIMNKGFIPAINRAFIRERLSRKDRFGGMVVIEVKHHFSSVTHLIDYDNIEAKKVIDYIAAYMLIDDSPRYIETHYSGVYDNSNYTEFIVSKKTTFILRKFFGQ